VESVPRWEWRTFGEHFGAVEDVFAALSPERVGESDELYLLSPGSRDTVKVRDALMDVKRLEQVDGDGLEQWRPVLKAAFPLSASDVRKVFSSLGVQVPSLEDEADTLEELMDALSGTSGDVRVVGVYKRRARYTLEGCMAELTDVRTERASTRTIAVESENAARVLAAVRELGLDARPNTSYPRGLAELIGLDAPVYAVIDVGTNSVKFHLARRDADDIWETLVDRSEITRLGEGLDETGWLGPRPMERTIDAIAAMAEEATQRGAVAIAAVGTAGLRMASNSAALVEAVRDRCDVVVEIIPGEEEARLAFLAATSGLGLRGEWLVVFDTGGGSSQFTFGHGGRVDEQFSVNVGAARYTEHFGLDGTISEDVLAETLGAIASDLRRLDGRAVPDALAAMGGAVTNLAAVKHQLASYDPEIVQGTVLDRREVDAQIELYRVRNSEERRQIVGLQPKRAELILAGACVVRTVMEMLRCDSLVVSDRGLRHGVLVDRFGSSGAPAPTRTGFTTSTGS
jgi:exopolyphosphatase/guanosine-5'-triphosphate,3'-diphosphate pyrophosphatase